MRTQERIMAKKRNKINFWKKIRFKYKLTILNENTLEDVFIFRVSGLSAFFVIVLFASFLIALTAVVIINTPIRNYLPGYLDSEIREEIVSNALQVDSLEHLLGMQTAYMENIVGIMKGETTVEQIRMDTLKKDTLVDFSKSKATKEFITRYEEEEKYNLSSISTNKVLESEIFVRPTRGIISSRYDLKNKHYGVDIAALQGESVLATLDGVVVFTGFDANAGYVIQLQHKNGLMSIYKHNDLLLKKMGDHVVAGEAIALVGSTGKLSSGPHLHFEVWFNGIPVDPETVIVF